MKAILFLLFLSIATPASSQNIDRVKLLSDLQHLSSGKFEGRKTGTKGNYLAAEFIAKRFSEIGLQSYRDNFRHPFSFKEYDGVQKGVNIIGYIAGKKDKVIIISAHYDHLGTNGNQTYYGADDNASGVSALLAFAEYFTKHKPENTLLFIAFDAEESGLRGATAFVKDRAMHKNRISLNINLDMIAHNDKNELYASGAYRNPSIRTIIEDEDKNTGIKILFGHDSPDAGKDDWTMQSDHGAFAKENIPFVYFGVEDHKDYHKPTDTFENINQDFYYGASTAILRCIVKLDGKWGIGNGK